MPCRRAGEGLLWLSPDRDRSSATVTTFTRDTEVPPRGGQCATRFEQFNDALIVAVRDCSAEQSRLPCPNDGRSVGAVAQHVAEVYPAFAHILATLQRGEQYSPSASMEDVDRENTAQAHAAATVERA